MSNRYTEISTSDFNPMSLQELMLVPAAKRQSHDEMLAKQELLRSGLAKVDPLSEHYDEAIRLKQEIEAKMDSTAGELAKNGVNSNMTGQMIALNRQYNDLISPTGRLGKINSAKLIESQVKKNFFDSTELKDYSLDAKQKAWVDHRNKYKGYDDNNNIVNIGDLSGPKYQDMQKDFMDLSSRLGEKTTTHLKNIGAHFEEGPFGNAIMKSGDGKTITTVNGENIKAMADTLSSKYLKPEGEGFKSRKFAGYDLKNTYDQLNGMLGIPVINKSISDMNYSYQNISAPATDKNPNKDLNPSVITDDVKQNNEIKKDLDSFSAFSKGINLNGTSYSGNVNSLGIPSNQGLNIPSPKNNNDPKEMERRFKTNFTPDQQQKYMDTYNAKVAQGKIPKGTSPYIQKSQEVVQKDWERRATIQFSNQIIDVTSMDNDILASPNLIGKLDTQKSEYIQKRLANAIGNKQSLTFDPENGKSVDMSEIDLSKVKLIGHYAPLNKLPQIGGNFDNSVSPYKISYIDEKGKNKVAFMARDASEMSKPVFRAAKVIKQTTDKAVSNEGNYTSFNINTMPELKNNSHGLTGLRVKFNSKNQTYTIEGFKGSDLIEKTKPYTAEEYQNVMYNLIP